MVPPRPLRRLALPALVMVQAVLLVLAVVAGVLGLVAGTVDRRWRLLRIGLLAAAYVCVEWFALLASFGTWVGRPLAGRPWAERGDLWVLTWALDRFLSAGRLALGFEVEVDDPQDLRPLSEPAPVLVLARHGGIGDSVALVRLLVTRYCRRPRIALKDTLALDPLADVMLTRLGACFLPPASRRKESGSKLVGAMAQTLAPRDALLLFPEGKNWTPQRWIDAIRRLGSEHAPAQMKRAALMEHVLPPRWGGASACLDARPDLAVVVFAHTGLDKVTSAGQVWAAIPFRTPMTVRWWPSLPPAGHSERAEWLIREWAIVDEWIDSRLACRTDPPASQPT